MEPWELEQLRRSIVMVEGSTVGPLTKEAALALVEEMQTSRQETARYRAVVAQLRALLSTIEVAADCAELKPRLRYHGSAAPETVEVATVRPRR